MKKILPFTIEAQKGSARAGTLTTAHGMIKTPVFMPVGTVGTVKALSSEDLLEAGAQIILGNTYHLHIRPGEEVIRERGGLHRFMNWQKPILTDSGGYQVFSLGSEGGNLSKIDEEGVSFKSHLDGEKLRLTPEKSIQIQQALGSDIMMAFDECTPMKEKKYVVKAMERTNRWLTRSRDEWLAGSSEQMLFGIIQGGNYRKYRQESAAFVNSLDLLGIAIGGVSVGYYKDQTVEHIRWVKEVINSQKPFYAMGVGRDPEDIVNVVLAGADMFDCVAPTRFARNGTLYHGYLAGTSFEPISPDRIKFVSEFNEKGRLQIGNSRFIHDDQPIMTGCDCATCKAGYSRSYLNHLYKSKELLYYRLASIHNIRFMIRLGEQLREKVLT